MSETSVVMRYSSVVELSLAATNHAIAKHFSLVAVAAAIEAKIAANVADIVPHLMMRSIPKIP
jgi:hypothetical protein